MVTIAQQLLKGVWNTRGGAAALLMTCDCEKIELVWNFIFNGGT
jgi:hypothetical protein